MQFKNLKNMKAELNRGMIKHEKLFKLTFNQTNAN